MSWVDGVKALIAVGIAAVTYIVTFAQTGLRTLPVGLQAFLAVAMFGLSMAAVWFVWPRLMAWRTGGVAVPATLPRKADAVAEDSGGSPLVLEWTLKGMKRVGEVDQALGEGAIGDVDIHADVFFGIRGPGLAVGLAFEIYDEKLQIMPMITLTETATETVHFIIPKKLAVSPADCRCVVQWDGRTIRSNLRRLDFPEEANDG